MRSVHLFLQAPLTSALSLVRIREMLIYVNILTNALMSIYARCRVWNGGIVNMMSNNGIINKSRTAVTSRHHCQLILLQSKI